VPVLKNVLGLDLGSHSVKAVELQQTLRGMEVVQLRELARDDEQASLPELLQHFVHLHRLSTEHVVTALPGDSLSSRRLSFPFAERRKLAQAVPFAVEGDLPFDLDSVVVDWEIVGGDRSRADVVATIAPRAEVSKLLAELDVAGCPPHTVEAEGLCLGNLAAIFDLPGVRLLADLGHRKSTFCLLVNGRAVAARTVRVGGRHISEALAEDRSLSLEDAELVKCEEGVFDGGGLGTSPRVEAVLDRIAREVARTEASLEQITVGAASGRVEGLTVFGGTAQLDGLDRYLAERTGIPSERLGLPREGSSAGFVAGGPPILYAPAIALALRGTPRAATRTNFRQDEFAVRLDLGRFRRDFRWTGWFAAAAVALWLTSFATGAWLTSRQAARLERESQRLWSEVFPGRAAPQNALAALRREVDDANERAEFLGVYRGNLSALDVLAEISRLVPSDLDISFEELSIDRQTVRMRVYAESFEAADRLGVELARFEPFAAARIGAIETDPKTGAKRFNVTISLAAGESRG
jgi:type IV pilus assembly protein PilM